ncbi:MAG TPA: pitrilysin family protein [Bacillota bacterium]|nr:pitrilysin family protein [Bacillota bacterium]HOI38075.1 pitrilysin family protein [Bacillota bacterium]HPU75418.1 pitrilysin family protein [Bacillota bacterium]
MEEVFQVERLPMAADLHTLRTTKFKTNLLAAVLQSDLSVDGATRNALLGQVLRRGTRRWPNTADFMRNLDDLYGTSVTADVAKKGERHMLMFAVGVVNDAYLGGGDEMLRKGFGILRELMVEPAAEGSGLRADYVAQEKINLRRRIESILDDKQAYAFRRCNEEMCKAERYAVSKLGRVEDIDAITPGSLAEWHARAVSEYPMDIFAIGDIEHERAVEMATEAFRGLVRRPRPAGPASTQGPEPSSEPRRIVERMPVSQGHLVMGYRTGITFASSDYPALLFANGVYGGYTHSKLFQNVRERASLAYFASSGIETTKGLMWVNAGIDFDAFDTAVGIIEAQLDDVRRGVITTTEMENTRRGLIRDIEMMRDQPSSLMDLALAGIVNGCPVTSEHLKQCISQVSVEDVMRVAREIRLDTVYFLRNEEGARDA